MSLLPDIDEEGKLVLEDQAKLYVPPSPRLGSLIESEERLSELNNFDRDFVSKDFSDSPHLNK